MQNIGQTIIGQYANSPTIRGIIERMDDAVDLSAEFDTFRSYVMDIDTAQGFGLDYLGRIIGLPREVRTGKSAAIIDIAIIDASIIDDTTSGTASILMSDDEYRIALRLKAYKNISRANVETVNTQLRMLAAGRGNAFVHDIGDMSITYYFDCALTSLEVALIKNTDMMIRPSGADAYLVQAPNTLAIIDSAVIDLAIIGT